MIGYHVKETGEDIAKDFLSYRAYEVTSQLFRLLRRLELQHPHSRHSLKAFSERITNKNVDKAKLKRPFRTQLVFTTFKIVAIIAFAYMTIKDKFDEIWCSLSKLFTKVDRE